MIQRVRLEGGPPPAPPPAHSDVTWWAVLTHFDDFKRELDVMRAEVARAAKKEDVDALMERIDEKIDEIKRSQDRVVTTVRTVAMTIVPVVLITLWVRGDISLERLIGWLL